METFISNSFEDREVQDEDTGRFFFWGSASSEVAIFLLNAHKADSQAFFDSLFYGHYPFMKA